MGVRNHRVDKSTKKYRFKEAFHDGCIQWVCYIIVASSFYKTMNHYSTSMTVGTVIFDSLIVVKFKWNCQVVKRQQTRDLQSLSSFDQIRFEWAFRFDKTNIMFPFQMTRRYSSKAGEPLPMLIIDSNTQFVKWSIISVTNSLYIIYLQQKKPPTSVL